MNTTRQEQRMASAAIRAAVRKGCDPYNTSAAAAPHYERLARMAAGRSEADANRHLSRQ